MTAPYNSLLINHPTVLSHAVSVPDTVVKLQTSETNEQYEVVSVTAMKSEK
jgi:hypothetical protein